MKKIVSIFFLLIFLFNIAGYFILFKIVQNQTKNEIRTEIESGIFKKELTELIIDKKDLAEIQWVEDDKEMRFRGAMYDVVKYSETNNTITFYCIEDSKEDKLFTSLEDHIDGQTLANKPYSNSKKIVDHIIKLYYLNHNLFISHNEISNIKISSSELFYKSVFIKKNSPPPQSFNLFQII